MDSDFTQQQSLDGLENAEKLSLTSTVPPAEIPGYQLENLLGQGAFGQVWLGRDLNTGRQVAIKFYLYRGGVNWSLLDREVQHLVNMSTGRYIVQVLAVGRDAEPPYYVMEYLENGSLEDMIRARGSLGINESVTILREIAEGLSYAHSKGVLHCDLKPANVMLDHDWRPRLADFGQSRVTDDQTPSLGTLFFMAPEQADLSASPDAAWDVYALGAIAYSLLVGSPPYRTTGVIEQLDTAESLPDRLRRYRETIRKSPNPRLHYRRRGIDKALCQIIDRCLAVQPEHRYSNVEQVIGAIDTRNRARTRRPLYLLGILGPVLFLILMLLFSARSISVAKQASLQRIQQWSLESNRFASKFAARTLEREIESLFRLVETEAQRDDIRTQVHETIRTSQHALESLANVSEQPDARDALRTHPEQQKLTQLIRERLGSMISAEGSGSGAAIFDSLFINDALGTNLAIHFADEGQLLSQSPVGRNFAYRSYFNGNREDGLKTRPRDEFSPIENTHLSAAFRSSSTGKWKVGISTPIWDPADEDTRTEQVPIGVLVLTINLGDFKLLASDISDTEPTESKTVRFAALVDGRLGNGQGQLLQHPFVKRLEDQAVNRDKLPIVPEINSPILTRLQNSYGIVDYEDPTGRLKNGDAFRGTWIAAIQQVHLPRGRNGRQGIVSPGSNGATPNGDEIERSKSDLWVLVQERGDSVAAPVVQLGSRLQLESYVELGSVLFMMLVLWYFVFRVDKKNEHRPEPSLGANDTNTLQSTIESGT